MSNNLSSIGALAYQGTNAQTPPNVFVFNNNTPAVTDWRNFSLGDFWINRVQQTINNSELYVLLGVANNQAKWALVTNTNGNINQVTTDAGVVVPVAGNINLLGVHNINTSGTGSTATVALNNSITLGDITPITAGLNALSALTGDINIGGGNLKIPTTNMAASQGVIVQDDEPLIHTYGAGNLFMGVGAGNFTMSPTDALQNLGIGASCLNKLTDGDQNCSYGQGSLANVTSGSLNHAFGYQSGVQINSGSENLCLGHASLNNLLTGSGNLAIGSLAGSSYDGSQSNNLVIGNVGESSDNNVIRIGTTGSSSLQQNKCFVAGITGISPTGVSTSLPVLIDSDGQLGATGNIYLPVTNTGETQGIIYSGTDRYISNYAAPGGANVFMGINTGNTTLTGSGNVSIGHSGLLNATTAGTTTSVGIFSLINITSGSSNTALGASVGFDSISGLGLVSGSDNVMIGYQAGSNFRSSESSNILISNLGVLGESGAIRIGTAGDQTTCYVAGITGVSVTGAPVIVDANGQLGITVSSIRYKTNIKDLNGQSENIYKLRPVSFNYLSHPENETWGLIAEEVEQVLPQLVVYNKDQQPETVRYTDLPVLLLNELQKLAKRSDDLLKRIELLESKLSI